MLYANLRAAHEAALICDFAHYYNIYDFDAVPLRTGAILAAGLPPDSHIGRELTGSNLTLVESMLAGIYDELAVLIWQGASSRKHRPKKPESLLKKLIGGNKQANNRSYASGEAFEAALRRARGG